MIVVNDRAVLSEEFEHMMKMGNQQLSLLWESRHENPVAILSNDAAVVISAMQQLRSHNKSALLLYGGTPVDYAKEQAVQAGCKYMLIGDSNNLRIERLQRHDWGWQETMASVVNSCPALYQFSSGTTGRPKMISRSWGEIDAEVVHYNKALHQSGLAEATPIILSSVSHSYGLISGVFSAIARGVTPIIGSSNNPKVLIQLILKHRTHLIYSVPGLLRSLLEWFTAWKVPLNALITSGAPLTEQLYEQLGKCTVCLIQQYGCTEAGAASLAIGMQSHRDLGLPLGHLRIDADHGQVHPVNKGVDGGIPSAELCISTSAGKTIRTGDLGTIDRNGRILFAGRIDDLIIVSGLKVQPIEVEAVISSMDGVKEAVVYRGEHPVHGDMVKAQIVADAALGDEEVRGWCRKYLPEYKIPQAIQFVDQIPKLPNGKVSRRMLGQEG